MLHFYILNKQRCEIDKICFMLHRYKGGTLILSRFSLRRNITVLVIVAYFFLPEHVSANETNIYTERRALYQKIEALTHLPWYYLAAFDQYERSKGSEQQEKLVAIEFPEHEWYGFGNITQENKQEVIDFFNGIGRDGNGDGIANRNDPEDILYTAAHILLKNGIAEEDIKISLWNYYQRDLSVKTIINTAKVYRHFQTNELTERDFPIAITHNYSYRSTWGHRRGFGGNRIHEGTDIFAHYGTPVKATTYGVIELKGWNLYGGWRIGIRDIHNIYHYYAHLNSYNEELNIGDIVKPGDVLGTVGSSGYGPPGTSGKFPPHLHYGMYKDNGKHEWSFDPYPYLRKWEQQAKRKARQN